MMDTDDENNIEALRCMGQCSVCRERFKDPRVLPCLHTFCFDCIQQTGSNKRPGEKMPCPLCRKEFTIPDDDFDGLQKDFRIQSLIEMSALSLKLCQSATAAGQDLQEKQIDGEEVYCYDCGSAMDIETYFEWHQMHNCSHTMKAVETFRNRSMIDEELASVWQREVIRKRHQIETERDCFLKHVNQVERTVTRRGEDMRRLIEAHLDVLVAELKLLKQLRLQEIEMEKDAMNRHLLRIQRCMARNRRLRSMDERRSAPGDICRSAFDLHTEVQNLELEHESVCIKWKPRSLDIKLKMTLLEEFIIKAKNNIVGTIEVQRKSLSSSQYRRAMASMAASVSATWRMRRIPDIRIQISLAVGLLVASLIAISFDVITGAIFGLVTAFLLFTLINAVVPKTTCLQLLASLRMNNRHASGVTYLRHRIYVIVQSPVAILVYHSQSPYTILKEIACPEIALPWDMASCHLSNSLYVTDSSNRCVWKVSLDDDHVTCWLTDMDNPYTISMSSDGHALLVRDSHPVSSLEVYGLDGVMVERIRIPPKFGRPHHAVETSTGTYLISHGSWIAQTHGLIELTSDGDVIHSYDSTNSFWGIIKAVSMLVDETMSRDDARHLAVDVDDRVLVADWFNDRILRFDRKLKLSRTFVLNKRYGAGWPIVRICYVKEFKEIMIVHETAKGQMVHIYQM